MIKENLTNQEIVAIAEKYQLSIDRRVIFYLRRDVVVAISVSGGKDSDTLALKLKRFLDEINFIGERILIHSDLGDIEHVDSLPQCRRLSAKVEMPLIVVFPVRPMIERWEKRHVDNIARYCALSVVKMITPWSSQSMRFCTSEQKVAPICKELKKMFRGRLIINAVGIRGEESTKRSKERISKVNKKLVVRTHGTRGITWNSIRDVLIEEVYLTHKKECFCEHECYSKNGNSRCSCCCCVLATVEEIRASMRDERNHAAYRRLVALEILSTYSFSQNFWLGDVCPELLDVETLAALAEAKEKAKLRRLIEAEIPEELWYVKQDFPRFQPSMEQCELIASVRRRVGELMDLPVLCTDAQSVYDRYAELLEIKERKKRAAKAKKRKKGQNARHKEIQ